MSSLGADGDRPEIVGSPSGDAAPHNPDLFGRRLIYVAIWSAQIVSAAVISPLLTYLLGPHEFGLLASAIALHQLLIVVAIFGIDQSIPLQRVEAGGDEAARQLVFMGTTISVIITVALGLSSHVWTSALGFHGHLQLVLATFLWTAPGASVQLMLALLLSQDRIVRFAWVSMLSAVGGQTFGILLILTLHENATIYAWGGVISQFAAMAVGWYFTRPACSGLFAFGVLRRAVALGVPLMISGLSYFVLNAADRVIIQRDLGSDAAGRYQVAYTVGYLAVLLLGFTSQAWTPRIVAIKDLAERTRVIGESRDQLLKLLMPMTLGITLAAPTVLRIVAPASFHPSSLVLIVFLVALAAFPVAAAGASGHNLIVARRGKTIAMVTTLAAAVNLALNIVFVPHFGLRAAAAATVIAFAAQALFSRFALSRGERQRTSALLVSGAVLTCVVSGATVFLPQSIEWQAARDVVGLLCLPWFLQRLRIARAADRAGNESETDPGDADVRLRRFARLRKPRS